MDVRAPWSFPAAKELDKKTLKNFIDETYPDDIVRNNYVREAVDVNFAAEAHDMSLLFVLWYIKQGDNVDRMFNTINGAQERKFNGGSQQLSERLLEYVGAEKLVRKIARDVFEANKTVTVRTFDGSKFTANHVIMAMAPTLLNGIYFNPPLHPMKSQVICV